MPETPFGWDISTRHWLYYEAWVVAGILFLAAWLLTRGRVGRAWRAIRDGDVAATSSGVNPALYKVLAFGISSFYAGAAGALFAIETSYVNPDTFPVSMSILLLASAVIGGLGSSPAPSSARSSTSSCPSTRKTHRCSTSLSPIRRRRSSSAFS